MSTKLAISEWPSRPLARVPGLGGAAAIAGAIRSLAPGDPAGPTDLDRLCEVAKAEVRTGCLSAAEGMREALLIPMDGDRFGITIDPTPQGGWVQVPQSTRRSLRRHRLRFRIGHELAHCLTFWRADGRPRRHLANSLRQEEFCDRFSSFLLVPPERAAAVPATAAGLLSLQRTCDVSLRVAAQALAAAQPRLTVALWFGTKEGDLRGQWASRTLPSAVAGLAEGLAKVESPEAAWLPGRRQLALVSESSIAAV